jgi:hypothetical protein
MDTITAKFSNRSTDMANTEMANTEMANTEMVSREIATQQFITPYMAGGMELLFGIVLWK